jgi:hypothetical protein
MLRQLAAPLAAAARDGLNRGLAALVWTLVTVGLGITGLGLLLATAVMGLSRFVGPIMACGLAGLSLVLLALFVTALRRNRAPIVAPRPAEPLSPAPLIPSAPPSASPPSAPPLAPDQLAFALGFVLARLVLAKSE